MSGRSDRVCLRVERPVIAGLAAAGLAVMLGLWPVAAAATPLLTASSPAIDPGQGVTLSWADDIAAADGVGAFDFSVTYDSAVLQFMGAAIGSALGSAGWPALLANAGPPGSVSISISQCDSSFTVCGGVLDGTGLQLLTLDFTALAGAAAGPTDVTVDSGSGLPPGSGEYQAGALGASVTINAQSVPVPAPGGSSLVLPGLVLAGLVARRRRVAA